MAPRTKILRLIVRASRILNKPRIYKVRHMDHIFIEEHNIADLYLLGKLSDEERSRFEEHFIDCQECLERLETTDSFLDGLKRLAIEEAVRPHAYVQAGILAWAARFSRRRQAMLLLSTILLLVALPAAFF